MENQHRKISGYRELSEEEVALMNEIKAFGPQFEVLHAKIAAHLQKQKLTANADGNVDERLRLVAAEPFRWLAIAKTDMQTGLMALTRAVAQPTFF